MNQPEQDDSSPDSPSQQRLGWPSLLPTELLVIAVMAVVAAGSWATWWMFSGDRGSVEVQPSEQVHPRVRINAASAAELTVIPGVGDKLSERIVEERTAKGPYLDTEDLLKRNTRLRRDGVLSFAQYLDFSVVPGKK